MIPLKCDFQPYQWGRPANVSRVAALLEAQEARYQASLERSISRNPSIGEFPRASPGPSTGSAGSSGAPSPTSSQPKPTGRLSVVEEGKRYAELWVGTHPSKPSKAIVPKEYATASSVEKKNANHLVTPDQLLLPNSTKTIFLSELLNSKSKALLGDSHLDVFNCMGDNSSFSSTTGNDRLELPFLLKILSIDKALSVQAHPDKTRAARLHKQDEAHYPDPNHKPELVVALTPFECLCCFRSLESIARFSEAIPELRTLIGNAAHDKLVAAAQEPGPSNTSTNREVLQGLLKYLYDQPRETISLAIDTFSTRINSSPLEKQSSEERVFLRISKEFPGDVGCWMVFVMNLLFLKPGEGLFLAPNEPHSYLAGDCVEIMAASDNVVRAGLTPKFKDVDTLLELLTYRTDSLSGVLFPAPTPDQEISYYAPPKETFPEFSLQSLRIKNPGDTVSIPNPLHSFSLAVVVAGDALMTLSKGGESFEQQVGAGSTFAIPEGTEVSFQAVERPSLLAPSPNKNRGSDEVAFSVFIGQTNDLSGRSGDSLKSSKGTTPCSSRAPVPQAFPSGPK